MADYNASSFPTSYNDPAYAAADQSASATVGIPAGWLSNIRTLGEKSNADQVSSAGARTPYQITPDTRNAIIKQTGVDPWLSPQTAAYGAAYLLKQSQDRNGGNPILATAEYHGGTDPSNWGPKTMAYVKRVTGSSPNNPDATPSFAQGDSSNPYQLQQAPDTSSLNAGMPSTSGPSLSKVFAAYKSGQMDPQSAAEFEADVQAGKLMLPKGMQLNPTDTGTQAPGTVIQLGQNGQDIGETPPTGAAPALAGAAPAQQQPQSAAQVMQIPAGAVAAFNSGQMPPDIRAQMQADIQGGRAQLPAGATLTDPSAPPPSQGFAGDVTRQLGLTARDAIQATGDTVGLGYDPIAAVLNKAGSFIGHDPQIAPLGAQAAGLADKLGLPQPVGSLERGVNAAAQGAAEAGTFVGAGGATAELPGIVGQLGKAFGADAGKQVAAMAAGQAAAQHAKDAGYSAGAQAAINLGTMAMTLGGMGALEGVASKSSPVVNDLAQRIYSSAKDDGAPTAGRVEPTMQSPSPAGAPAQGAAPEATVSGAPAAAPFQAVAPSNPPIDVSPEGVATPRGTPEASAATPNPTPSAPSQSIPQTAPPPEVGTPSTALATTAPQEFMPASELATQARKAVGAEGAPFGLGKNSARDVLATQAAPNPEIVEAANRLGMTDMLDPDHLTTNQSYRELAQAIKSNPGSLAGQAQMDNLQGIGLRAQQMIEKAGGTTDLSDLSAQVKNQHQAIINGLGDTAEGLYGEVNKAIPAGTAGPAPNTLAFINQRLEDLGGNVKNLTDGEQRLLSRLTPQEVPMKINGQTVDPASLGMEPQLKQPTYALLDNERQHIGMALDGQLSPFSKAPVPLLKKLYGELAQDQEQVADDMGVGGTYRTAAATVEMRKSYEDDMTKLYGRQLSDSIVGKLGTAMSSLSKGDESKFVNFIKSVPDDLRKRVTTSGLQYAFGNATKNGALNFKSFADWMDGVKKNSGAFNALMANLPADSRRQFLDLATVSRGVANSLRENISTGRIMAARQDLGATPDGVMSRVLDKAKEAAVGVGVAGAAHAAGPIGAGLGHAIVSALSHGKPDVMKAADELLVSPEFTQLAKAGGSPSAEQIKALSNSGAMRRFYGLAKDAGAPRDPATRERWLRGILGSIQSEDNSNVKR